MKDAIKTFFKGDVSDNEETLAKYSHDASLFTMRPKLVVFPKDSEDVKNLVKWVRPPLSITARSAGTDMSGGPLSESIIMDFTKYMNKLIKFNYHPTPKPPPLTKGRGQEEGSTITVQPGMYYRDFEKIVSEKGLMMPAYPASKSICAMGGIFGNNAGGEKSLRYGKTEDYIESVKVVFSDGNEYEIKKENLPRSDYGSEYPSRGEEIKKQIYDLISTNYSLLTSAKPNVSKNSAGYYLWNVYKNNVFDLNKLLVGSQGTLGIITEITFKLIPKKKYSRLAVVFLKDLKNLAQIINEALKLDPESVESYDDNTLKVAVKFFYEFPVKLLFSFIEEFLMVIKGGLPKLIMLIEFAEDDENLIEEKIKKLKEVIKKFEVKVKISKSEKYWEIRRRSFNLLREHVKGKRTAPFIDDFIVRPEFLPEFLPKLNKILDGYKLTYTIAGHPGDGNFHIIPLVPENDQNLPKIVLELSEKIYDLVLKYGGSITAEHNDGIIRTPYLEKMYGSKIVELFHQVKQIFDPQNIFNPGKKVGGTRDDIQKYLK